MFKKDRKDFESKWDDIKTFIEYGILQNNSFLKKASEFALYKNTQNEYYTLSEFTEKIKDTQKNKDGKIIVLYSHNVQEQHSFVKTATERGYQVLSLGGPLVTI